MSAAEVASILERVRVVEGPVEVVRLTDTPIGPRFDPPIEAREGEEILVTMDFERGLAPIERTPVKRTR